MGGYGMCAQGRRSPNNNVGGVEWVQSATAAPKLWPMNLDITARDKFLSADSKRA
jgi:hypothetical protein